jgi:hypothetical protein
MRHCSAKRRRQRVIVRRVLQSEFKNSLRCLLPALSGTGVYDESEAGCVMPS